MKKINKNIINKAIEVAKTSNVKRGKVSAIIFTDRGEVLAFSSNTRFYSNNRKFTIHAEEMVLAKAFKMCLSKRYANLNMLVLRWQIKEKRVCLAKPCEKCQELLKRWEYPVYYTTENGIKELW